MIPFRTAAAAMALAAPLPAIAAETAPDLNYSVEILAEGLDRPWSLELLPGSGDVLIAQRGGQLRLWRAADGQLADLTGAPAVVDEGQGGLMDLALAPDFDESGTVYVTWTGAVDGGTTTHVGRFRLNLDEGGAEGLETLYRVTPANISPAHFGSRMVIADGHLFVGTGDRAQKDFGPAHTAQDLSSSNGSVLRLTLDGAAPDDNPFAAQRGAEAAIWSYGHRNIQAMALNPETGAIWVAEHGENGGDEINIVQRGANFGWPLAAQGLTYSDGEVFAPPHAPGDGFVAPVWHSPAGREDPFPPSGMAFVQGDAFPEWQGALLAGNLGQQYLGLFAVDGETVAPPLRLLEDRGWRIRDVAVAPDGTIWGLSDGDDAVLFRIVPEGS